MRPPSAHVLFHHRQLILNKSDFTLEELLEEEELIQECKSLNGRLINLYVIFDLYVSLRA